MEPITMTALATSAITILTPFLKKGAEAIATGIGKDLWNLVKKPFQKKEKDQNILEEFKKNPDDPKLQGKMEIKLEDFLEENPEFVRELQKLLPEAEKEAKMIQNVTGDGNFSMQNSFININK